MDDIALRVAYIWSVRQMFLGLLNTVAVYLGEKSPMQKEIFYTATETLGVGFDAALASIEANLLEKEPPGSSTMYSMAVDYMNDLRVANEQASNAGPELNNTIQQ